MKEYFSHDYHARADEKIIKMLRSMGPGGYGIYWMIIEMLYENNGTITKDYDLIAYDLRVQMECVKMVCEDFDLFYFSESGIHSVSVGRRLKEREERSSKASFAGRLGGIAKRESSKILANATESLQQPSSKLVALKESKGKESKEKRGEEAQTPPTILQVRALAEAEGLKADPDKFFHWQESKAWAGIIDWQAAFRYWCRTEYKDKAEAPKTQPSATVGGWQPPESFKVVEIEQSFHGSAIKDGKCIYCKGAEIPVMGCNCEKYGTELAKYKITAIGGR